MPRSTEFLVVFATVVEVIQPRLWLCFVKLFFLGSKLSRVWSCSQSALYWWRPKKTGSLPPRARQRSFWLQTQSFASVCVKLVVLPEHCLSFRASWVLNNGGARWRSWSGHCAISRKVTDSIPSGGIDFFHWHNAPGRIMTLGSTQPLTEMRTRNIYWGGGV